MRLKKNKRISPKLIVVDKLDIPKLTTVPIDLVDLTKKVQEDFTKKTNFNSLKTKVDKNETDNDNLETTTKTSINNLKTKVDNIDLTKYVLKSNYDTKIGNLELKIPDVCGLLQVSSFNSKINELENKIKTAESKPNINNLATKSGSTAIENKIPDVNGFVKKANYPTEITTIKNDYATNAILDSKINDLKSQHISDAVEKVDNKVVKNTSDILKYKTLIDHNKSVLDDLEREASFFRGKDYYLNSWLLFRPTFSSFTRGTDSLYIEKWKSLGLNDESELIAVKNTSNNTPKIVILNEEIGIRFSDGDYFKQEKVDYIRNKVINIHIVYKLTPRIITEDEIIQTNGLFGNLKIGNTKSTLHYRYYDGIGVFFDAFESYGGTGINELRNLILYGADMKNSSYSTNKKYHIYTSGKNLTQTLQYGATIYADHDYVKVNGSQVNKKFIFSVHYNGDNSYLFINGIQQFKFKAMSSLKLDIY